MDLTKRRGKIVVSIETFNQMVRSGKTFLSFMIVMFAEHNSGTITFFGHSEKFDEVDGVGVTEYGIDGTKL